MYERVLRLHYHNNLNISEFLHLANSATVHHKKLSVLVTEFYKVKNGTAPEITKSFFELQNILCNLKLSINQFRRQNVKTVD